MTNTENAVKIIQRSLATKSHILPRARVTVTGSTESLTSSSSDKLHQLPPGKIERTWPINPRSLCKISNSTSPWPASRSSEELGTEIPYPLIADFGGGNRNRQLIEKWFERRILLLMKGNPRERILAACCLRYSERWGRGTCRLQMKVDMNGNQWLWIKSIRSSDLLSEESWTTRNGRCTVTAQRPKCSLLAAPIESLSTENFLYLINK